MTCPCLNTENDVKPLKKRSRVLGLSMTSDEFFPNNTIVKINLYVSLKMKVYY